MDSFWSQFLSAGLGSGFAFALIKVVVDAIKLRDDRQQREHNRRHLALRLAIYLEGYALNCATSAADHQLAVDTGGGVGTLLSSVPEPGPLPSSEAYDLLDVDILNDVFDFPQRRQMAQASAMMWWQVPGQEEEFKTVIAAHTIKIGISALAIARTLRARYEVGLRNMTFGDWDIHYFLADQEKRLAAVEKEREAGAAEKEREAKAAGRG